MASKLSYASSPLKTEYLYESIPERLRHLAAENPTREAFIFYTQDMDRVPISRQDLVDNSNNLAKVLAYRGLEKGQTVGVCMNNSIEMLLVNFAVITAGGIPFFMATNLRDGSDIVETMNDMKAAMLFIDANEGDDNWKIVQNILSKQEGNDDPQIPSLEMVVLNGFAYNSTIRGTVFLNMLMASSTSKLDIGLPKVYPEDVAVFFLTSGSTGKPKVVRYTHFNLLNFTRSVNNAMQISGSSIHFSDRSFSWAVGYPRVYLIEGTTRIFIDTKVSLSGEHVPTLCDIIQKEHCDVLYLPSYLVVDLLENLQMADKFNSVRTLMLSGERFHQRATALKEKNFCKSLYSFYGSTESGGTAVYSSDNSDDYEDGVIGGPIEGMELKIVDEEGDVVEMGQSGELYTRSHFRFLDYKDMPETFAAVVDRGNWFHTGDTARMREDGTFVVEGRIKELISMQNMKYFPWDIEKVVRNCPTVKTVVAVGVPDARLHQVVCVCVVPNDDVKLTETDVKSFCDETFLDEGTASRLSLKPRYIHILDKIPLTVSGKINRLEIAAIARRKLGL